MHLDVGFDFRTDSGGKDSDVASPSLRQFHKHLWSKPLPNGETFILSESDPGDYLKFKGGSGYQYLASDSIGNSYMGRVRLAKLLSEIDTLLLESFRNLNCTIGGYIIFPSNRIDGKPTINGERGFNHLIADRFDLTLECIRLHYSNYVSPLSAVLERYNLFFSLFQDFKGYVDFFLLNDLVSTNYKEVQMFNEVEGVFEVSPVPKSKESYLEYRKGSMEFTKRRNLRIETWAKNGQ